MQDTMFQTSASSCSIWESTPQWAKEEDASKKGNSESTNLHTSRTGICIYARKEIILNM